MSCPYCSKSNNGPFQMEYNNGGDKLLLVSYPSINYETHADSISCLSSWVRTTKNTTEVELMNNKGEQVSLSGDLDLVLNILEKLK